MVKSEGILTDVRCKKEKKIYIFHRFVVGGKLTKSWLVQFKKAAWIKPYVPNSSIIFKQVLIDTEIFQQPYFS